MSLTLAMWLFGGIIVVNVVVAFVWARWLEPWQIRRWSKRRNERGPW